MKKPNLTYNQILLLLAAGLLGAMVGSVTLGRYPIGLKELGGILVSRVWDMEPFWTKTQEALLLQHLYEYLPRLFAGKIIAAQKSPFILPLIMKKQRIMQVVELYFFNVDQLVRCEGHVIVGEVDG